MTPRPPVRQLPSRLLLVSALALSAATVQAQTQTQAPVQDRVNLVVERSNVDNGSGDWLATTLRYGRHWSQRQVAEVELTQTRRFGLDDTEVAVTGSAPLSQALTINGRLTYSATHRVLPEGSAAAALQYEFAPAWLVHGGWKATRYPDTDVNQGALMLEHYFGNWSALAGAYRTRAFGQDTMAYVLRGSYYYGQDASVSLYLASGDEVAQTGPGTQAISSVRSVTLVGQHGLSQRWTLRYGLHYVEQGTFYTRKGASLGVQYTF